MSLSQEVSTHFPTVEALCTALSRHRVLPADQIRSLYHEWSSSAGKASELKSCSDEPDAFRDWLIAHDHVTAFQFQLISRGFADQLYFGAYKILERIGQGRMAGVYKAVNPEGELVALKVLPPSKASNPRAVARFQRESKRAAKLRHPNIVLTIDYGTTAAGLHYIVMELLPGKSLDRVLKKRGPLSIRTSVSLALQLFRGLEYLFQHNYVHRDLKPSNLMVLPGQSGSLRKSLTDAKLKILDIGLARALFAALEHGEVSPELTCEGVIVGTPKYMAPEQARSARTVDIRGDLYSAGCILYEMLAGRTPFTDETVIRQLLRHAEEMPKPISEFNPTVPPILDEFVSTLLAKAPDARFLTPVHAEAALLDVWEKLVTDCGADNANLLDLEGEAQVFSSSEISIAPTQISENTGDTTETGRAVKTQAAEDSLPTSENLGSISVEGSLVGDSTPIESQTPAQSQIPVAVLVQSVQATNTRSLANKHTPASSSGWWSKGSERLRLSQREWTCFFAGAGALLAFQLIVWVIWQLCF